MPDLTPIPLDELRRLKDNPREADPDKHHSEPCLLCGSPLTVAAAENGAWVNLAITGRLVPVGYAFPAPSDDQGWFPIGADCARRVPAAFKQKGMQ